jgi:hypothetical protein
MGQNSEKSSLQPISQLGTTSVDLNTHSSESLKLVSSDSEALQRNSQGFLFSGRKNSSVCRAGLISCSCNFHWQRQRRCKAQRLGGQSPDLDCIIGITILSTVRTNGTKWQTSDLTLEFVNLNANDISQGIFLTIHADLSCNAEGERWMSTHHEANVGTRSPYSKLSMVHENE